AETYLQSEAYAWNAGIFLFRASDLLVEAETYAPAMLEQTKKAFTRAERDGRVLTLPNDDFSAIAGDSIDYAIMEKTSRAAVVSPVNVGWSDIGSWAAVKQLSSASSSDAFAIDCSNTLIKTSSDAPFVGAIGLEGYVVVATKDSVLIVPADRSQEVKTIVEELKKTGRTDQL
ncbi:MAG: sugar phosphate nucleotidyltransferase, partial [Pseudomonadota bacterium]